MLVRRVLGGPRWKWATQGMVGAGQVQHGQGSPEGTRCGSHFPPTWVMRLSQYHFAICSWKRHKWVCPEVSLACAGHQTRERGQAPIPRELTVWWGGQTPARRTAQHRAVGGGGGLVPEACPRNTGDPRSWGEWISESLLFTGPLWPGLLGPCLQELRELPPPSGSLSAHDKDSPLRV